MVTWHHHKAEIPFTLDIYTATLPPTHPLLFFTPFTYIMSFRNDASSVAFTLQMNHPSTPFSLI